MWTYKFRIDDRIIYHFTFQIAYLRSDLAPSGKYRYFSAVYSFCVSIKANIAQWHSLATHCTYSENRLRIIHISSQSNRSKITTFLMREIKAWSTQSVVWGHWVNMRTVWPFRIRKRKKERVDSWRLARYTSG